MPRAQAGGRFAEVLAVAQTSSREVIRHARARVTSDVLVWPCREEFDAVWQKVSFVPGWFLEGTAAVLYPVLRAQRPATVLEIGSYLGRSTVFFGLTLQQVNPEGRVVAVDPHTGDRQQLEGLGATTLPSFELFQQHCRAAGVDGLVEAKVMTSQEAASGWRDSIDLLYIDGWHSYDAVLDDGTAWLPHLAKDGLIVFDDYLTYDEVGHAVHDLADAGLFHLWGSIFGQAFGGTADEPPPALRRALRFGQRPRRSKGALARPGAGRLNRERRGSPTL
jgi:predicted O-methyltransferase YrrM